MANNFNITISAVDKATAVFRKVNGAVNQLTRPFERVGQSFKNMGRELGFQRVSKNLSNVGREAAGAARGVASIVAPMAAITGVGSIAGIAALADNWSRLGRSTLNTAANMGANTTELQKYQGAAKLAGVSSEDMSSSLQGLATTMENAQFGRDNGALMLFNRLGVGIKHTATGAMDATGQFKALATSIAGMKNPQQQMLVAQKFGLTALLPLIRQGPKAMDELSARAEAMGLVMSGPALKAANDFANSLDNLHGAGTGLKNTVMEQLTPALKPLVDELAGWIVQNRVLIGQDIGRWAKGFATWIDSIDWKAVGAGIRGFVTDVGELVDRLGGWKATAIGVAVVMNAGLIASVVGLGVTLARGGVGVLSFIGLLAQWAAGAKAAKVATLEAEAAAVAAGRGGAALAGAGVVGIVGSSLALSGDQSEGSRTAANLEQAAMAGDRGAAIQLANQQLNHWFLPKPSQEDIEKRADDIASGRQAGIDPKTMATLHPDRKAAQAELTGLEKRYDLPPGLLDQVWRQESSRGINMQSGKGAKGHFGFMDPTAEQYGLKNPNNFSESADAAARMYRDLLKANGGDMDKALAAYNWGQGNLNKKGLDQAPEETRNYIRDIEAGMKASQAKEAPATPAPAPQGPYSDGSKGDTTRHAFEVTFNGLPSGATPRVKSASGADVSAKIGYSAVGSIA